MHTLYNIQYPIALIHPNVNTVSHRSVSVQYDDTKLRNDRPAEIKGVLNIHYFERFLLSWSRPKYSYDL
jgi:hypothetical protein